MSDELEAAWQGKRVYTVGHSTRSLDELVALLRAFDVNILVDVRTIPRSRHNPQFGIDALRPALRSRKLGYAHVAELGGLRRARPDSPNAAWRNRSFQGYADYMLTEPFASGLDALYELASRGTVALMCAEAVPWRCHRSLIADALTVRGARVEHIASAQRASAHRLTPFARVQGARVTYPGDAPGPLATVAPFHLEATVRVLQRRPTNLVDQWRQDRYMRVLPTAQGPALVEVVDYGSVDAPELHFRVVQGTSSRKCHRALASTLRMVLGLDLDPTPLLQLTAATPKLRRSALALRGMRPPRYPGLFEALVNVLAFQQISLDAGVAIVRRLVTRFGTAIEHEGQRYSAFPEAHSIARARVQTLRDLGLTTRKSEALRGAARALVDGQLSEEQLSQLDSEEAMARLMELPGIGPWSAGLLLLRGLRRLDVFPPGDVGVARALVRTAGLTPGASMERLIARFGKYRGYLYFHALGSALLARELIHAASSKTKRRA